MKNKCLFSVMLGCILCVLFSSANAQEDVIQINSDELGEHQRPIVTFSHQRHADMIECARCHHDYDEFGSNLGGDGRPCSECHGQAQVSNPVALMKAFHLQCKGCHEKSAATGRHDPPRTCGRCHEKRLSVK